jgi:hypothetical protein
MSLVSVVCGPAGHKSLYKRMSALQSDERLRSQICQKIHSFGSNINIDTFSRKYGATVAGKPVGGEMIISQRHTRYVWKNLCVPLFHENPISICINSQK